MAAVVCSVPASILIEPLLREPHEFDAHGIEPETEIVIRDIVDVAFPWGLWGV